MKETSRTGIFLTARVLGQFTIFKEKGEVLVICVEAENYFHFALFSRVSVKCLITFSITSLEVVENFLTILFTGVEVQQHKLVIDSGVDHQIADDTEVDCDNILACNQTQ